MMTRERESSYNLLLTHKWGESIGADRVLAEISGCAPATEPWRKLSMVAHAYIDDSYNSGGVHVLAGYISRVEDWAAFSAEWEQLLPHVGVGNSGKRRFKMKEMSNRMNDVRLFYNVIEKYVKFCFSIAIKEDDLLAAKARVWSDNYEMWWTPRENVTDLLAQLLFKYFHSKLVEHPKFLEWMPSPEKIDLYLDEKVASDWLLDRWNDISKTVTPEAKFYVGERPRFVNDESYLPLQAADLYSWWVRMGYNNGTVSQNARADFGNWAGKTIPGTRIELSEDALVHEIIDIFKSGADLLSFPHFYDSKVDPKTENAIPIKDFGSKSEYLRFLEKRIKALRVRD